MRSNRLTAVKFFDNGDRFSREFEVYQILRDKTIRAIAEHAVPRLVKADIELLAIEMSIVERPFVLDFAGTKRTEEIPDFEPEIIEEHHETFTRTFRRPLDRRPAYRRVVSTSHWFYPAGYSSR